MKVRSFPGSVVASPRFSALLGDVDALRRELSPGEIPAALSELEHLRASLILQMVMAAGRPGPAIEDRLLTVAEAARRLGIARDTLYRKAKDLPFTVRIGGLLRFSSAGIEKFVRARQGRP
jgi:excisionase family DNA binding protein